MLAVKNMNELKISTLWEKVDLKSEPHVQWLKIWCKTKLKVFLNILNGKIEQISEESPEESAWFTLEDFLTLEFKSWLFFCEHEYLKFVNTILFRKLKEHNLINNYGFDPILELIRSGMLKSRHS